MKIILIGASGSGKDTIANYLNKTYNLTTVKSYTTRPKRTPDEDTHTFVDFEEYQKIKEKDKIAETYYNEHRYCATIQQLENADIYIIDKKGLDTLRKLYKKPFKVFYIDVNEEERYKRLCIRDNEKKAKERILNDRKLFNDIHFDYYINGMQNVNLIGDFIYNEVSK